MYFSAPVGWTVAWSRADAPDEYLLDGLTPEGSTITGSETPTLRIAELSMTDADDYLFWMAPPGEPLELVDICTLRVDQAMPEIIRMPQSREVCLNGSTVLEVEATGTNVYMWSRNGTPLSDGLLSSGSTMVSGAESASLALSNVDADAAGVFDCLVLGGGGGHQAYAIDLTVSTNTLPPLITQQPASASVCPGGTVTLMLAASAATPDGIVAYQWRKAGVPIVDDGRVVGANWPGLEITEASPADSALYDCVLTQACGEVTTVIVGLRVGPAGDANNSGAVDFDDIIAVLGEWGETGDPFFPGDADGNGLCDFDDVISVLGAWGADCG